MRNVKKSIAHGDGSLQQNIGSSVTKRDSRHVLQMSNSRSASSLSSASRVRGACERATSIATSASIAANDASDWATTVALLDPVGAFLSLKQRQNQSLQRGIDGRSFHGTRKQVPCC